MNNAGIVTVASSKKKNNGKDAPDTAVAKTDTTTNYTEIYCTNCKKSLGRYNTKFYSEDKIMTMMMNTTHSTHIRDGHTINVKSLKM